MEASEILRAVRAVIGDGPRDLQKPVLNPVQIDDLSEAHLWEFEAELKSYTGARFVEPVSSGTAALHLALIAAGVSKGDEVLCPSLTFAATANAIVYAGAIPHFVDVNQVSLGIHPFKLRQYLGTAGLFRYTDGKTYNIATDRHVSAIVPVHLLGIACEIWPILSIAKAYGIAVVEDAAEALGTIILPYHVGTIGKAGILSFNFNKIVTTGGGGAVLTNDPEIAYRIRHLSSQAKVKHPFLWQHDDIGFNYRMPPICAALGVSQMKGLDDTLKAKAELSYRYNAAFADMEHVKLLPSGNYWLNAILLDPRIMKQRNEVLILLTDEGFGARALFTPLHMQEPYKDFPRQPSLVTSEDLFRRVICLPSSLEAK